MPAVYAAKHKQGLKKKFFLRLNNNKKIGSVQRKVNTQMVKNKVCGKRIASIAPSSCELKKSFFFSLVGAREAIILLFRVTLF